MRSLRLTAPSLVYLAAFTFLLFPCTLPAQTSAPLPSPAAAAIAAAPQATTPTSSGNAPAAAQSATTPPSSSPPQDLTAIRWWLLAACAMGTFLLIGPPTVYFLTGWQTRKEDIINSFTEEGFGHYFAMFDKGLTLSSDSDLRKVFRQRFAKRFGLRHYILPMNAITLTAALASWILIVSVPALFRGASGFAVVSEGGISALLGAYLWTASDCLERLRERNLSSMDVYNWTFRFLIAVPFGYALSTVAKEDFAVPLSFFLGAFPTQTLFTIARRIADQKFSLGASREEEKPELEHLQCVGRADAERFQDQGIDTIASLAWADPVDLTIRTNFQLSYVMDCMSQSLLWVYFGKSAPMLYPYSLRGSQEAIALYQRVQDTVFPVTSKNLLNVDQCNAITTVEEVAKLLGLSECVLVTTLYQVANDPYAIFLNELWK